MSLFLAAETIPNVYTITLFKLAQAGFSLLS